MQKVAKFEKVSKEQFIGDFSETFPINGEPIDKKIIELIYNDIQLPKRSTKDSMGYDIHSTLSFTLNPKESIKIPTGLRCKMEEGWGMFIMARSGIGFKYFARTANIIPVIDGDYYYSDNEGHIWIKIRNEGNIVWKVKESDKIAQAIFVPYGITYDDNVNTIRNGGFGSTGN